MSQHQGHGPGSVNRKPEGTEAFHRRVKRASSVDAVARATSRRQPPAGSPRAPTAYRRSRAQTYNMPMRPTSRESMSRLSTHSMPRPQTPSQKSIISNASVPISAFVSPHAPSVTPSAMFHMRNPHRPPKKPNSTGWSLRLTDAADPSSGSPTQAWLFFMAFLLFPLWWLGSFWSIPLTRTMGEDAEKVMVDDPQVEHDARSWRFRCRVMSIVSLFTYLPFIILVAIFAR